MPRNWWTKFQTGRFNRSPPISFGIFLPFALCKILILKTPNFEVNLGPISQCYKNETKNFWIVNPLTKTQIYKIFYSFKEVDTTWMKNHDTLDYNLVHSKRNIDLSLKSGIFSEKMNIARITPVFKSDDHFHASRKCLEGQCTIDYKDISLKAIHYTINTLDFKRGILQSMQFFS